MNTIDQRIADCIKISGLTKTAFAERINVGQPFVSQLCSGAKIPSDRTIADICREFNVSEPWLRNGEGEMLLQLDKDAEFNRICEEVQLSEDVFIKQILRNYWKLDEKEKAVIRKLISGL